MGCELESSNIKAMPPAAPKPGLGLDAPPLTALYLYISGSCNLACRHCWISPAYEPDNGKGRFMALAHVKKAVVEAKPLGLRQVKLSGGEPTLHPEFREIVDWIDQQAIAITIESNGTLIDDDLARFLKSKARVSSIAVSVDGALAASHEALRGIPGSFARAVSGIRALAGVGFKPQMICTLHRGNARESAMMIKLAAQLGCGSLKFNVLQGMGRGDDFPVGQKLEPEEILRLYRAIAENGSAPPLAVHFDIPPAFRAIRGFLRNRNGRCHILNILGVLADGNVSLCGVGVNVPELVYGDITKQDLGAIWRQAPGLKKLRALIPAQFQGICAVCIHHWNCLGSCIAQNFHEKKQLNAAHTFCENAQEKGFFPASRLLGESLIGGAP